LGLSICARIVELFNGQIWVDSDLGKGSTLHFTAKFGLAKEEVELRHPVELAGLRVLVTDDNSTSREMLEHSLNGECMKVTTAVDGAAALEEFARAKQNSEPFDFVILDDDMLNSTASRSPRKSVPQLRAKRASWFC